MGCGEEGRGEAGSDTEKSKLGSRWNMTYRASL